MPLTGLTSSKLLVPAILGGIGSTPLLLDTYTGAAFAYSFRKLRTAYAGSAVRIRRSSDNTEQDIGFSGNGFDTTSASNFIGVGSGFIVTWYDQSGNGLDVTQATTTQQPLYSATGLKSLPTANFDGSNDVLARASVSFGTVTQGTIFAVHQPHNTSVICSLFDFVPGTQMGAFIPYSDNNIYFDLGSTGAAGRISVAGSLGTTAHIVELYRDSGNTQAIVVDGTSLNSGTGFTDTVSGTSTLNVGVYSGSFDANLSEFVFWTTDLGSTNRTGARTNINSYYLIF